MPHHCDLTALGDSQLTYELAESKSVLQSRIGRDVMSIAYPSGAYNFTVIAKAKDVGYAAGWKKSGGPVTPTDDMYLMPRIRVHGRTTMDDFRRKVWSGVNTVALTSS